MHLKVDNDFFTIFVKRIVFISQSSLMDTNSPAVISKNSNINILIF